MTDHLRSALDNIRQLRLTGDEADAVLARIAELERHLADMRDQLVMGRRLVAEKDARIAGLEAERDALVDALSDAEAEVTRLTGFIEWQAPIVERKARPDDVVIIDGMQWRATSAAPYRFSNRLVAVLVPVEDK